MALPRSTLPFVVGGALLFGVLMFLLGVVVGLSSGSSGAAPSGVRPAISTGIVPPPSESGPAKGGASGGESGPIVPLQPAPEASPAATAVPPPAPIPAPAPAAGKAAASGGATPDSAPAIKLLKVKGFGFGAPPSSQPASSLRGALLRQAASASAVSAAPAVAAVPGSLPPADVAKEAPGEPLVFSVAVGRFLLEASAGRLSAALQAKGYQPVIVVPDPPDSTGWLTVTLGPQSDAIQASRLAEAVDAQGFETWLVSWQAP